MGQRIRGQRRGRGGSTFRAPSHRYKSEKQHRKTEDADVVSGTVVDIEHDPARSAPVAAVEFEDSAERSSADHPSGQSPRGDSEGQGPSGSRTQSGDGEQRLVLAPEGISVGETLQVGISAEIKPGNTLPLAEIPEGVPICNLEANPGDGGKYARSSGVSADLVTHDRDAAVVKLPSGEVKRLDPDCRATIGVVAGGGRTEKPFVKAGNKHHKMKTRGTIWPRVRGVAMNAVDHPFGGGGRQHPGKPKSISRNAPPGRKVGDISSRRTGKGSGNE